MTEIKLWISFWILVALIQTVTIRAVRFQCQDDGFHPDPNDCTKFYRCVHGQQFSFDCAPGTHYNPSMMVCDWPYSSGCVAGRGNAETELLDPFQAAGSTTIEYQRYRGQPNRNHHQSPTSAPRQIRNYPSRSFGSPVNTDHFTPTRSPRMDFQKTGSFPHFREVVQTSPTPRINPDMVESEKFVLPWPKSSTNQDDDHDHPRSAKYFQPNKLYFDPETGIYHRFHYKPEFVHEPKPSVQSTTATAPLQQQQRSFSPGFRFPEYTSPRRYSERYQQQQLPQPQPQPQRSPSESFRSVPFRPPHNHGRVVVVDPDSRVSIEDNHDQHYRQQPKSFSKHTYPEIVPSASTDNQQKVLVNSRPFKAKSDRIKNKNLQEDQKNQYDSHVVYEDEVSEYVQPDFDNYRTPSKQVQRQDLIRKPPFRKNPTISDPSLIVYKEEEEEEREDLTTTKHIKSIEPKESIQPRKYSKNDGKKPDVIVVDSKKKSVKSLSIKATKKPITTTTTTTTTTTAKPYVPPINHLKQSKQSPKVLPSAIRLSRREKELTNKENDEESQFGLATEEPNRILHETEEEISKKLDDDTTGSFDKIYDSTSLPETNLSMLHDKIRDFIATFNPNALLADLDDEPKDTTITTTESPSFNQSSTSTSLPKRKPSTMQSSYVVYENETQNQLIDLLARMIGLKRLDQDDAQEIKEDSRLPECVDQEDSWQKICKISPEKTGTNFEWLQVAEQSLKPEQAKFIQTTKTETLADCQRFCWRLLSNCVGFTFDREWKECQLAYDIAVDSLDSINDLDGSNTKLVNFLEPSRKSRSVTTTSSFIKPQWYKAYNQIKIGQNLMPRYAALLGDPFDEGDDENLDEKSLKTFEMKTKLSGIADRLVLRQTFFDCWNECSNPNDDKCQFVLFHHRREICLVKYRKSIAKHDDDDPSVSELFPDKYNLRRGWSIGIRENGSNAVGVSRFQKLNNPVFIRLFEQLLIGDDKRYFLGRYLEPMHRLENVINVEQCQNECSTISGCRFVAIYEDLLQPNPIDNTSDDSHHQPNISCLLFDQDLVEILIKLMVNEQEDTMKWIQHRQSSHQNHSAAFVMPVRRRRTSQNQQVSGAGTRIKRQSSSSSSSLYPNESKDQDLMAYVFDTPEPFLKFRILHRETIEDSERIISPPYQEWNDVFSEDKCYLHCSNSWLIRKEPNNNVDWISTEETDHLQDAFNSLFSANIHFPPCRFLVVKAYQKEKTRLFNCSFYELSPIAFTEQSWYTVREIPDHLPLDVDRNDGNIEDYFNESETNHDNESISLLDETISSNSIHYCLEKCLQTLMFNGSARHCFKVHVGLLKSGQYKCRFYDRVMNESDVGRSKLYRLRSLPEDPFVSIPNHGYLEYFDQILSNDNEVDLRKSGNLTEPLVEWMLGHYEPLYVLNGESNPHNCLRLCVLLWGRAKSGHQDPDRCRLVFAQPIIGDFNFLGKIKYRCMIFDLNLMEQLNRKPNVNNRIHSQNQYPVNVYRVQNQDSTTFRLILQLNLSDYQSIFDPNDIENAKQATIHKALYHFSGGQSPEDCLQIQPRYSSGSIISNTSNDRQQLRLIIAKPLLIDDPILPGRLAVKYECLYYDQFPMKDLVQSIDFDLQSKTNEPSSTTSLDTLAYQLIDEDTYENIDPQLEPIKFAVESYRPILSTSYQIRSEKDCLELCSEFNYFQKSINRFVQCRLILLQPNQIIQNVPKDYRCTFYNFNVSSKRNPDVDTPKSEQVEYYHLNSVPIITRFDSEPMKYESLKRINRTEQIRRITETIVLDKRLAFQHLSNVTDRKQCFDQCLRTWESKSLYYNNPALLSSKSSKLVQSHFCRLLIVIPVWDDGEQQTQNHHRQPRPAAKYECAFFETNFTQALKSFAIPETFSKHDDDQRQDRKRFVTTEDDTLYMITEWPLISPKISDQTLMLSRPVDINHCLMECDRKTMERCQAIITRYEHNRLIRCLFIGQNEYLPDFSDPPMPNHQSKIYIKLFNVQHADQKKAQTSSPPSSASSLRNKNPDDPYLAIIDLIRRSH